MGKKLKSAGSGYLVTGAAGFIGMHVSKALLEKGADVIGFDNINDYYDTGLKISRLKILKTYPNFTFYKGSLEDKTKLFGVIKKHKTDIVVHLAAQAGVRHSLDNPDLYVNSNINGFLNILEACRHNAVKHLVFASSSSVYGANTKVPFSTGDKTDSPVSLYGATKKADELMAHAYSSLFKFPSTGLRFFTVYGPYGRPDMAYYNFTMDILKGKPIRVFNNGDMYRDFTYIDDIVSGVLAVIEKSAALSKQDIPYKIYNIGNNKPVKLTDFIGILEVCLGKKAVIEFCPMQKGDVYKTFADIDDLVKDTGFKPSTAIETGLGKFVEWIRSSGKDKI